MSQKNYYQLILFAFLTITSVRGLNRCCKTGGIIRYMNSTISCIPALLPDSLNVDTVFMSVTPEVAAANFEDNTEGFICRDIVFDERSGLALRTQINVSVSATMDQKFPELLRYDIRKCCNNDQYFNMNRNVSKGCCAKRPDMERYDYIMAKFPNYYLNNAEMKDDDCHRLPCTKFYYFIESQIKLYIFGDEITESPYFQHTLIQFIVSEMEATNYCTSSELDPIYTWYSWCTESSDKYGQLKFSLDKIIIDLKTYERRLKEKTEEYEKLKQEFLKEEEYCREKLEALEVRKKEAKEKSNSDNMYYSGRKRYIIPVCKVDKKLDKENAGTPKEIAIKNIHMMRYAITLDRNITDIFLKLLTDENNQDQEESVFNCSQGAHFHEGVSIYDSGKIIFDNDKTAKFPNYCLVYNKKENNYFDAYVCGKSSTTEPTWFLLTVVCLSLMSKVFLINVN